MTFSMLIYAIGGYAVVFLAATLALERARGPVPQPAPTGHPPTRPQLRAWPRATRRCPVAHERALPLRSAQHGPPARRQRPAPTSCRR